MFYTFDIGNTNSSLYFFNHIDADGVLIPKDDYHRVQDSKVFVSSVNSQIEIPFSNIETVSKYRKEHYFLDMPVQYTKTLGEDRLIAGFYFFKTNKHPVFFIDAGSFTTVDQISAEGFLGGLIFPGVQKIKNLYSEGNRLSPPETLSSYNQEVSATSTESAILMGASLTIIEPIKFLLKKSHNIFISGGSGRELKKYLNEYNVKHISHPVHLGLRELAKEVL